MIIYTVFEPDDASGQSYRWYGDSMVYVHRGETEGDAFEVDGPGDSPPSFDAVADAVEAYHREHATLPPHEPPPEPTVDGL